ncbi:NADH-quinone oxidoreductase subunit N [Ilumatobacter sp.]|uniref:NADH-quinone oxidoreductase subunit N n=1 Tax=Ilumatobacter sp. TaxID=1967498 RepID=UPI003C4AD3CB
MNLLAHTPNLAQIEPTQRIPADTEIWWFALSPLLVLVGGALLLIVVGALTPKWPRGLYAFGSALIAGTAGVLAIVNWDDISDNGPATLVHGALAFDTFAMWSTITICGAVVLVSMLADEYLRGTPNDGPEIYALLLVAAAGGIVMASANDLIVLFLGLETLSLAFYVLAASNRRSDASAESGLKYFLLGGFASAFFLYGIALVYGATGSTNIGEMVASVASRGDSGNDTLALAGIALLIVGLGFKVAAAPFHIWAPDVYQGAPTPVTAFMASAGKAAAFGAMIRVLIAGLPSFRDDWQPIIWILAVLSLVVGSFLAVVQRNVKRMLAYSSVSHAGFILVGVEAAAHTAGQADSGMGISSVQLYLLLYMVIVIGSFGVVAVVARDADADLSVFNGLAKRKPLLAGAFTIFLLAQAGVPFTSGFIAKFGVIQAGVSVDSYGLALIAMISAVIAAFLYLRIMVSMWQHEGDENAPAIRIPVGAAIAIGFAALFTVVAGLYPSLLIDWSDAITLVR